MHPDLPTYSAAATATVTSVTAGRRILRALRRLLSAIWDRYRVWQDIKTLESLDDRTLKDIGLHRSEIEWVRRHCRWGFDPRRDL
jgi:uncharacterized protein YjiS (DUF1127 family)